MDGKSTPKAMRLSLADLVSEQVPSASSSAHDNVSVGRRSDRAGKMSETFGSAVVAPEPPGPRVSRPIGLDEQSADGGQPANPLSPRTVRRTVLPENGLLASSTTLPRLTFTEKQRYVSQREIGSGSMGLIDLALDTDIQRNVAIKTLRRSRDPAAIARMTDEIRIAGQLEHPNIVPVHDVGVNADGDYFFVMRLVNGLTLREIIDGLIAKDLIMMERIRIFRDIVSAVAFAHSEGVLHQDLKPENLMVGDHGEVFVMDWGLATYLSKSDRATLRSRHAHTWQAAVTGTRPKGLRAPPIPSKPRLVQGTPFYMSPEQTRGKSGMTGEVYTLCVIFHEFLGLSHYLEHLSGLKSILRGVQSDPVSPLFKLQSGTTSPRVPIEWSHFIEKGVSKRPEERFETVHELLEAFNKVDEGLFPVECPTSLTKRGLLGLLRTMDRFPLLGYTLPLLFTIVMVGLLATAALN